MPPKREVTSPEGEGSVIDKLNTPIPVLAKQNTPAAPGKEIEITQTYNNNNNKEEKEIIL